MSLNIILVFGVFIVILIVLAIFVAQQFSTVQKNQVKKTQSLSEKLAAGGFNPLDSERFREIALTSSPSEDDPNRLVNLSGPDVSEQAASFSAPPEENVETPEELAFQDPSLSQNLQQIDEKDLQALYSEYLTAKSLNPFDVEPEFKLGLAYLKNAQYEKAQSLFQNVVESRPDFPGIYYYLGESYRCNGQFYEAMQAYKQSWEMDHLPSKDQSQEIKES